MGLITPFVITGKRLVQHLARSKASWDEPLSEQHLARWQEWLEDLQPSPEVKVDRCLQPPKFADILRIELHHFSDASTTAYGAASYLRRVNMQGHIKCGLIFSRSQAAPMKQMTIPRLELAAAALSVQQDEMMRRELFLPIGGSSFWTDSAIVLA